MTETGIFFFINRTLANPVFDVIMPLITEMGSGEGIFVLSFLPLFLAKKEKKKAALLIWAGLTITYYLLHIIKNASGRPRPFMALPDTRLLIAENGFSFPSGHATQSFMAATVLSEFFAGRVYYFCFAALVAFSRVYLGVHYVSDVLSGALLGISAGYLLVKLSAKAGRV